jgi:hypothetical protein
MTNTFPHLRYLWKGVLMSRSQPSLPTNRAFVVQFRPSSSGAVPVYTGRVEHVVSGEMTRFHSLDELLAFMRRVLLQVEHDTDLQ